MKYTVWFGPNSQKWRISQEEMPFRDLSINGNFDLNVPGKLCNSRREAIMYLKKFDAKVKLIKRVTEKVQIFG